MTAHNIPYPVDLTFALFLSCAKCKKNSLERIKSHLHKWKKVNVALNPPPKIFLDLAESFIKCRFKTKYRAFLDRSFAVMVTSYVTLMSALLSNHCCFISYHTIAAS